MRLWQTGDPLPIMIERTQTPPVERRSDDFGQILVVDDDAELRLLVARFLERHGFLVTSVSDSAAARSSNRRNGFDLVILDIMLPGATGIEICRELRAVSTVPIIMLTARSDEETRVTSLEGGADDYVTKPFSPRELLARVRSLLRRSRSSRSSPAGAQPNVASFANWSLNLQLRELTSPEGALVDLSTGEFDLLSVLIEHAGRVLSRDALMELAKSRQHDPFDRSIDVQISRLRRKLEQDGDTGQFIKTIRGSGYMFSSPVKFSARS